MRIQKLNKSWYVGLAGTGVLALLAIAMLCPMTGSGVQAADCTTNNPANCPTQSMLTQASVNVAPTIALALQDTINIDVSPTVDGSFGKTTASLAVSTNSNAGYSVYLQAVDGDTLKNPSSINSVINPVAPDATQASFGDNTWGYNLGTTVTTDSTVYQPVPSTQTVIDTTDAPTDKNYNFTLATKVDTSLPSGSYTNTITVSAVANPQAVGLMTITNMQDMTSALCNVSEVGDTKQLVDTRDGKKYWVAKMKDGNCWMTQNLALDITTAGLKAADTDISADWNSSSAYPPKATMTSIPSSYDSGVFTMSWNLSGIGNNQWLLGTPLKTAICDTTKDIDTCTKVGLVKIDDTWSPTFEAKEGVFNVPNTDYTGETTYVALDYEKKEYDAHYLIGNYYQWNATTAGTGGNTTNTDAAGSICPKGWQLAGAGDSTHPTFSNLLGQYGITNEVSTTGDNAMPNPDIGLYNIAAAPLYFVRTGRVNIPNGGLKSLGSSGAYRSSMTHSSAGYSCALSFGSSSIYKACDYNDHWYGFPLRCVAR